MTLVLNQCNKDFVFPATSKKADILSIYIENVITLSRRSISITTLFSNKLEKPCSNRQFTCYIEIRRSLSSLQVGFRRMVSAQDAILCFAESIQYEIFFDSIAYVILSD